MEGEGITREQRPWKTEIGTEVAHVTRDSDATFNVKRSKVNRVSQICVDISIRLNIIPASGDRQTDRQTSINATNTAFCVHCMLTCDNYAYKATPNITPYVRNSIIQYSGLVFACYYCCILHSRFLKVFNVRHLINGLLTCLLTYLKQCIHVVIHSVLITVVGFVAVFGSSGVLSRSAVGLNVDTYYIAADTSVHGSQLGHRPVRVTTEITHSLPGWRALGRRALVVART